MIPRYRTGIRLKHDSLGLHLDYSMEFRSQRVGDIPPVLTSSLLPSFPFLEKPRRGTSVTSCSSTPEETDSPQSHYLTKRARRISSLTDKDASAVPLPEEEGGWPAGELLARNPQVGLASLLTRRMRVSSLYPMPVRSRWC